MNMTMNQVEARETLKVIDELKQMVEDGALDSRYVDWSRVRAMQDAAEAALAGK